MNCQKKLLLSALQPPAKQPAAAVRLADYKLIEFYDPPRLELYNIKEDISEKNNLAEKMPQKTAELRKLLNDFLKAANTIMHTPNPNYKNAK